RRPGDGHKFRPTFAYLILQRSRHISYAIWHMKYGIWHIRIHAYQGRVSPRWKNPPVGPPSGASAKATAVFAPSTISIGARSLPISVFTQPGWAEFTLTFVPSSARAVVTVSMFSAAFDEQ